MYIESDTDVYLVDKLAILELISCMIAMIPLLSRFYTFFNQITSSTNAEHEQLYCFITLSP